MGKDNNNEKTQHWYQRFIKWLKTEINNLIARLFMGKKAYVEEYERQVRMNPNFNMLKEAREDKNVNSREIKTEENKNLNKSKMKSIAPKYCNIEVYETDADIKLPVDRYIMIDMIDNKKLYIDKNDLEQDVTDVNLINSNESLNISNEQFKTLLKKIKEAAPNVSSCHLKDAKNYMKVSEYIYDKDTNELSKSHFSFFTKSAVESNKNENKIIWQALNRGAGVTINKYEKDGKFSGVKSTEITIGNNKILLTMQNKKYNIKVFDKENNDITKTININKVSGLNVKEITKVFDAVKNSDVAHKEVEPLTKNQFVINNCDIFTKDMIPENKSDIQKIVIPNKVRAIENGVLSEFNNLKTIEFHGTLIPMKNEVLKNEHFFNNTYEMLKKIKAEYDKYNKEIKDVAVLEDAGINTGVVREYSANEIKELIEEDKSPITISEPIITDNKKNLEENNEYKQTLENKEQLINEETFSFTKIIENSTYQDVVICDESEDTTRCFEETNINVNSFGNKLKRLENQHREIIKKGKNELQPEERQKTEKNIAI